jgi:formate dehydrogenase iron-sulfur subunit
MKAISRRTFLVTAATAAGSASLPATADAAPRDPRTFDNATAKLYDATRCIGCRNCLRACRAYNQLPPDVAEINGVRYDLPQTLSTNNLAVIQAYQQDATEVANAPARWTFIKKDCMHCNTPACASACPVAALRKTEEGPVLYDENRCIGCRYCMLACPFGVPRFEWVQTMPRIRKCNFNLACVRACPVGALQSGTRRQMLDEAHRRIRDNPGRYVDHVYGEFEAGGTSYLILSGVPFEKLGLPVLPPTIRSRYAEAIMGSLPGLIIGLGLFLGGLYHLEKRQQRAESQESEQAGAEQAPAMAPDKES